MPDSYDSKFLDDPDFQSLLVGCLESLQRGETIDRDALVRDFPNYAQEIGQFLDDRQLLEQVASDLDDVEPSRIAISAYAHTMDSASSPKDFTTGETVRYIGEYEILDEIARGGMGVVFKARQGKLNRIVALKMILAGRLADTSDLERFYREARAAGRLVHPNIVPVHEIGEHDGRHYFTMDFVEGRSLADQIRDETLAPRAAAEIVQYTAEAVQYAHDEGTVHRDLKPGNVLIDASGRPKVTDFGLAKMLGSVDDESRAELTASGQVLGTPSYMSPEQASGKQELVGPASDIYSLGAILYASLTGRAPFVADSPVDTLLQVMNKDPVSPRELNPSVPKDLETICLKCLTKEPHKRYGTAQELADDLGRFLEGHAVIARPIGPISKTTRWCRRNKAVAALMCLLFLTMAVGTAASSYFAIEASDRAQLERQAKERQSQLRQETEQLAGKLKESLDQESNLRNQAQREQQIARQAEQRAKTLQLQEATQRSLAEQQEQLALQREKEARWHLYVSRLYPLMDRWKQRDFGQLDRLLEESVPAEGEPDFRNWEWYYLRDQTRQFFQPLPIGEGDKVIAYHHETERLAVLFNDRLEVWDPWTSSRLRSIPLVGKFFGRHNLCWSPDGTRFAFSRTSSEVEVISVESGESRFTLDCEPRNDMWITGIDWSPDERWIATGCRFGDVKIWDAQSGALVSTLFDPDDQSNLGMICWHPDSKRLALALRYGWTHVLDVESKKRLWAQKTPNNTGGIALAWRADGSQLAAGHGGVAVYGEDGEKIHFFDCHRGVSRDLIWIDSKRLLSGGSDQDVVLLNVPEKKEERRLVHDSAAIDAVIWDKNHQRLITAATNGIVKVARLTGDQPRFSVLTHDQAKDVNGVSFSPDGHLIVAAAGRHGAIWEVQSLEMISRFAGNQPVWYANWIHQLKWRSDSQVLLGTCKAAQPVIWDRKTKSATYPRDEATFQPWAADWSPDGKFIALATNKRSEIWRGDNYELAQELDVGGRVHWSSDGKHLRIGTSTIQPEHGRVDSGCPEFGVFSPDERLSAQIANRHSGHDVVRITDTQTGESVTQLKGHNAHVSTATWSPNGRRIGTASRDGTIKIWDAATGDLLITLPHPDGAPYLSLAWNPDGRILAAGTTDGEVHLYGRLEMPEIPESSYLESGVLASVKTIRQQLNELRHHVETNPDQKSSWLKLIGLSQQMQLWDVSLKYIDTYLEKLNPGDTWRPARGLLSAVVLDDQPAIEKYVASCQKILHKASLDIGARAHAAQALCLGSNLLDDYSVCLEVTAEYAGDQDIWYQNRRNFLALLRTGEHERLIERLQRFRNAQGPQIPVIILSLEGLVALDQGRFAEARQISEQAESLVQTLPDGFVKAIDDQVLATVLSRELKSRIRNLTHNKN